MPAKKSVKPSRSSQPKGSAGKKLVRQAKEDAPQLIQSRHKSISEALDKLEKFEPASAGWNDLESLCRLWSQHRMIEEEILYPEFRKAGVDEADISEAEIVHDLVSILMGELLDRPDDDTILSPGINVLRQLFSKLIESKEQKSKSLFASAKKGGVDMGILADKVQKWMSDSNTTEEPIDLRPRHVRASSRNEYDHRRFGSDVYSGRERNQPEHRHDDDEGISRNRHAVGYHQHGDYYPDDRARYDNDRQTGIRDKDSRHTGSRSRYRDEDSDHPQSYRSSSDDSEADRGYDDERSRDGGSHSNAEGHFEQSRRSWEERRSSEGDEFRGSPALKRRRNP